jgi:hypothetical protein
MKTTLKFFFWGGVIGAVGFLIIAPMSDTYYKELEKGFWHLIMGEMCAAFYIFLILNVCGIVLALLEGLLGLFNGGSIWK